MEKQRHLSSIILVAFLSPNLCQRQRRPHDLLLFDFSIKFFLDLSEGFNLTSALFLFTQFHVFGFEGFQLKGVCVTLKLNFAWLIGNHYFFVFLLSWLACKFSGEIHIYNLDRR